METWKQKLGSNATYNNLIGVFERAGYQGYADTVRDIFGMYHDTDMTIVSLSSLTL